MAANGKNSIHYTKKSLATSRGISVGFKKLKFYHEPTLGDTVIDLTALVLPSSNLPTGASNPSAADIAAAKLLINKDNFTLISFSKGVLEFDDYEITTNTQISLKDPTESGELFIGIVDSVPKTGLQVVDSSPVVLTATLAGGTDEVITGPFDLNKYPTTQQGSVMVFLDGQLLLRNVSNAAAAPGADGNYQEVGTGTMGSSIKFNLTDPSDRQVTIVSNGLSAALPNDSLLSQIETSAGQIDAMVPTLAALAGVSEATFQGAPNSVDLLNFGTRLQEMENYELVSATFSETSTSSKRYIVDTTGGAVTVTLPAAPTVGMFFEFWDSEGNFDTANLIIDRNSQPIEGVAADYTENRVNARIKLVYVSGTRGWIIGDMT